MDENTQKAIDLCIESIEADIAFYNHCNPEFPITWEMIIKHYKSTYKIDDRQDIKNKAFEYCKMYSHTDSISVRYSLKTLHNLSDDELEEVWDKYLEYLKS